VTVSPLPRKRVGIFPRSAFQSQNRLLVSLADLYPVDFSAEGETGFDHMDAAIFFSDEQSVAKRAFEHGVSSLVFPHSPNRIGLSATASVSFSGHRILHPSFRNAEIPVGSFTEAAELKLAEGDSALACHGSLQLWLVRSKRRTELHRVATEFQFLQSDRLLWEFLRPDGWLTALPLVHFVRRVTADVDWSPAPQHACFMFDDPNLHYVKYGYIDYARLAAQARERNYHVAIATIPLDAWYADRKAVDVFRRHERSLSLLIHGNDHVKNELGCDYSEGDALCLLAQALRRVARFERRTGLRVERVIAPPHGGCSDSVLAQASRLPVEAICTSAEPLAHAQKRTSLPLAFGLLPAWFGPGCCPVIRRWDLVYGLMPLRLAAFLGQAIVAYGHHQDCAEGLEPLAQIASVVNTWGETNWASLETILGGNYRTMRDNELMHVQMCSRNVRVPVPEKVSYVVVHSAVGDATDQGRVSVASRDGQAQECTPGVPFRVAGPGRLQLRMQSSVIIDPATVSPPAHRLWPALRRALSTGRDRLMPLIRNFHPSGPAELDTQQC
jgi:hypothetical protein